MTRYTPHKTVKAIIINDPYAEPLLVISQNNMGGTIKTQYSTRLPTGELIMRYDLAQLLSALARRVKKEGWHFGN